MYPRSKGPRLPRNPLPIHIESSNVVGSYGIDTHQPGGTTMATLVLALSSAEGDMEAFYDWYQNVHMAESVRHIPSFKKGQRYVIGAGQFMPDPTPYNHLAIYEAEGDAETVAKEIQAFMTSGDMSPGPPGVTLGGTGWVWTADGDPVLE
jgi:hypothetical protein